MLERMPWTAPRITRQNVPYVAGDATFFHSLRNAQMSVRWVYLHMIGEYARHNGHADLLRERIDGATGL